MTAYRLVDHGYPFKKIMRGREWVGRVCRHGDGGYLGVIGKDAVRAATEVEAFEEVAARAMGYPSAAALRARNSRVRRARRVRSAAAETLGNTFLHADTKTQLDIIDRVGATPQGGILLIDAVARALRRPR